MSVEADRVADALTKLTDGSLTFRIVEDDWAVVAAYGLDGRLVMHHWPKWRMADYMGDAQSVAEDGVMTLLSKGNTETSF